MLVQDYFWFGDDGVRECSFDVFVYPSGYSAHDHEFLSGHVCEEVLVDCIAAFGEVCKPCDNAVGFTVSRVVSGVDVRGA